MPFGGFKDFDACVVAMKDKGHSEEEARRICGRMQAEAEMSNFNNQWIEIFRPGDYGDKGAYTADDLDTIVGNFDATKWQPVLTPPAQIGHADTAPALGLVKALRRSGESLEAQFEKVHPKLEEVVRDGRFPNRSVGLYRNPEGKGLMLRHVAFLGAVPPEVKGLQPVKFSDGDYVAIDFQEETMDAKELSKTVATEIRNFFTSMFGEKRPEASFTEEQVNQRVTAAVKAATDPLAAQVTALSTKFDESVKAAEKRSTEATAEARRAEAAAFVKARQAANQWVPAFTEAGMDRVLEHLAVSGGTVKFGEAGKEKEVSHYSLLCNFFESLPAIVPTKELAKSAKKASNLIQFTEPRDSRLAIEGVELAEAAEALLPDVLKQNPKLARHEAWSEALRQAQAKGAGSPAGAVAAGRV